VYRIALSVSVSETFQGIPETLISMEDFWSHSLLCAFSAQELTTTFQVRNSGAIYAAGLLHDIGQLVLFANRPEKATEVLERCLDSYEETDQAIVEKEIFGFTHAEVGFELARMWSFPELLQECIAFHHEPESANKYRKQARLINLSNVLAIMIEIQSNDIDDAPAVDNHLRNAFGRELMDIGLVCRRIEERFIESKRIILGAMI
jgi:putative nucleotidyltransferase with HDIG domain